MVFPSAARWTAAIRNMYNNISFIIILPGHRHHRRTQSAPPTTVHKHVQSNYIDYSKATQIEDRKSKGFANLDVQLPSSPFARQNSASPVRKFLTFVREVAEKRAKSTEKSEQNSDANSQYGSDEFLEVVLDGSDVPSENGSARNSKGHSPSAYSLDDTVRIKSSSLEKVVSKSAISSVCLLAYAHIFAFCLFICRSLSYRFTSYAPVYDGKV